MTEKGRLRPAVDLESRRSPDFRSTSPGVPLCNLDHGRVAGEGDAGVLEARLDRQSGGDPGAIRVVATVEAYRRTHAEKERERVRRREIENQRQEMRASAGSSQDAEYVCAK